ncbi:MAG: tetratricopeptide repeat protein [Bacteroidetes bacterium]|uniref:Tetratricopeptide repeat protein n=1 Tax=Candidatus Pullibacteroides excrementavium TaxID=2840905 RepID=A0A9D9DU23_9BACT|nr:tetratricopeptide repeat protein [Candidatus Pullibacteroides excrementavium]
MKTKGRAIRILVLVFVLLFSLKSLQAKTYPWKIVHPVFDSLAALLDTAANPNQEEQEAILKQLETISLSQNNAVLNIRYRFWNAYLNGDNWNTTQNENAKNNYLLETLSYIDSMNYDYDYARILFLILNSPNNPSDYLSQYQQLNQLIPIFQKYDDILHMGHCYRYLGILFGDLAQFDQAIGYFDKADECYAQISNKEALATNATNRAVLLYYMGEGDSSVQLFKRLLQDTLLRQRPQTMISLYINLSLATVSEQQRRVYEDSAFMLIERYPDVAGPEYRCALLVNIANRYHTSGNTDSAILFYKRALENAEEEHLKNVLIPTLMGLSSCYAQQGNYKDAYENMVRFYNLQEEVRGSSTVGEINRKENSLAINEYQNQLAIQAQKMSLQKRMTALVTVSIALLAIILLVILLYLRQKKKLAETSLQNKELQTQQLQQEVDYQNRELSSNMLILSENRSFLQQVLTQLEKMRSKGDLSNTSESELRKMITSHIQSEDEWDSFKIHFEKVHPGFFNTLKEKHPNLTTNDLKLCAYIRIGLNIKQIAQMTAVLPATIKTNRYLLKKKLQIDEDMSIDDYIASLGQ